jgi:phosphoribosylpyrophosphate synthetase
VSIGAKLVANMLTAAGVDRIMTMDLHADQIQGFFEVPVDHLFASSIFLPYIKEMGLKDLVMAAPDTGGTKRANAYAKHLGVRHGHLLQAAQGGQPDREHDGDRRREGQERGARGRHGAIPPVH